MPTRFKLPLLALAFSLSFLFAVFRSAAFRGPAAGDVAVIASVATAPAALRPALAAADAQLAAPLRAARRALPQARRRYPHELPEGSTLLVTVRLALADTAFRMVQARVFGWREGRVQALVPLPPAPPAAPETAAQAAARPATLAIALTDQAPMLPAETAAPTPLSFPESAVIDWTIRHADGREEGNFVGRYLEGTAPAGSGAAR